LQLNAYTRTHAHVYTHALAHTHTRMHVYARNVYPHTHTHTHARGHGGTLPLAGDVGVGLGGYLLLPTIFPTHYPYIPIKKHPTYYPDI